MPAVLHRLTLPGAMLQRGFWLYVWRIATPSGALHYVGRTGDNSSPHAAAPFTRMGQHLGTSTNSNDLRRNLIAHGVTPENCTSFDLIAHGPIYSQVDHDGSDRAMLMERHKPFHDQVGAMEKLLCDGLKYAGYDVLNTVNCKWVLSAEVKKSGEKQNKPFTRIFPH